MKKILLFLSLFIALPVSAMTLYDYYGGHLPSIAERAPVYAGYFDDEYAGTAEQNTNLVSVLVDNPVDNSNQQDSPIVLGATLPQGVAVFQTSLLSAITSSASSMTLVTNSVRGGSALSGFQCFTVDEGSSIAEYICGTVAGTAVTSLVRGVDPLTATTTNATLQFAHRRGAEVKVTDFPVLQIIKHQLSGEETFDGVLKYNSTTPACSGNYDICGKAYIDGVAVAGAPNSTEIVKGISELATQIESASSTSLGSTGASVVLQAKYATSSPTTVCGLCVPITRNDGKISPNFIATTSSDTYNFGGLVTYNASTSLNATTTISASNVTNRAIILNNTPYAFPSTQGVSGSKLRNDGVGNLSWVTGNVQYTYGLTSGSVQALAGVFATTTMITIPASVLTASSSIQILGGASCSAADTSSTGNCLILLKAGNVTIGTLQISPRAGNASGSDSNGNFSFTVVFNNSLSSEKVLSTCSIVGLDFSGGGSTAVLKGCGGGNQDTAAVDFSAATQLNLIIKGGTTNATAGLATLSAIIIP